MMYLARTAAAETGGTIFSGNSPSLPSSDLYDNQGETKE